MDLAGEPANGDGIEGCWRPRLRSVERALLPLLGWRGLRLSASLCSHMVRIPRCAKQAVLSGGMGGPPGRAVCGVCALKELSENIGWSDDGCRASWSAPGEVVFWSVRCDPGSWMSKFLESILLCDPETVHAVLPA